MRARCGEAGEMGIRDLALALGYDSEHIDLNFVLDLPLPEARLGELERWAREKSGGYKVVTWLGLPPPQWREAYSLMYMLEELDYPPEEREPLPWTADRLEFWLRSQLRAGGELVTTLVVDGTSAPAATSRLPVSGPPRTSASQNATTVLSAHRGQRLSALAKVANLKRLRRDFPQTRTLHTAVAVDNETMWAINERFGFRVTTNPRFGGATP